MKKYKWILFILIIQFLHFGCTPEYLEVKQDKAQLVPVSLDDFKSMLDNFADINANSGHSLGILASDEFYLLDDSWELVKSAQQRNAYHWAEDIFETEDGVDWNRSYKKILYANLVLEGLTKIELSELNRGEYNHVKGSALFLRGLAYFNLAQLFSPLLGVMDVDLYGLPLRLESDPTLVSERATVTETYRQILQDVSAAGELLSNDFSVHTRPTKRAAFALKSRIYHAIEDYPKSLEFANLALSLDNKLLDFNTLDETVRYPFPPNGFEHPEVIFYEISNTTTPFAVSRARIDTTLYKLYNDDNDLRKSVYFFRNPDGSHSFRGSYCGAYVYFTGLANDELYLNKAESLIRDGKVKNGLDALNEMLLQRYKANTFHPYTNLNQDQALKLVLIERRKELLLRGIRWSDLRRLNESKETEKTLVRYFRGEKYTLLPRDRRYTFPIPESVIMNSKVKQFDRK